MVAKSIAKQLLFIHKPTDYYVNAFQSKNLAIVNISGFTF